MREIKFRGQIVDNNVWVYGSYTQMREDDHNECFKTKTHKTYHRIWQWEAGDWNMGGYANYEVIPETIGQFTGLKDKNGVEIYEGDQWKWDEDDGLIYVIDFCEGGFGAYTYGYYRQPGLFKYGEVIGNIHDKAQQKQAMIDMMRCDEEIGLYDDNPKNH